MEKGKNSGGNYIYTSRSRFLYQIYRFVYFLYKYIRRRNYTAALITLISGWLVFGSVNFAPHHRPFDAIAHWSARSHFVYSFIRMFFHCSIATATTDDDDEGGG